MRDYTAAVKAIRATLEPFFVPGKLYRLDCLRGRTLWTPTGDPDKQYAGTMKSLRFPSYGQGPFGRVSVPHKGILLFVDFAEATARETGGDVGTAPFHLKFLWSGERESKFVFYSLYHQDQAKTFRQWFTAIENIPAYKAQREADRKIGWQYQEIIQKRQEALKVSKVDHMRDVQKAYSKWQKALARGDANQAATWKEMHEAFLEKGKKDLL